MPITACMLQCVGYEFEIESTEKEIESGKLKTQSFIFVRNSQQQLNL